MGVALQEYTTFIGSQGPAWASGTDSVLAELDTHVFTHPYLTAGGAREDMVQSGQFITDRIRLDYLSTTERIGLAQKIDYPDQQTGIDWRVDWAFQVTKDSWTEQEVDLNSELQAKYRAQKYKDVRRQHLSVVWSDICETKEREFWAPGDWGSMEALNTVGGVPRKPNSLLVFNNEFTNGLFPSYTTAGGGNDSVMGISRVANPKWRPYQDTYTFDEADTATHHSLFNTFSKTWANMHWAQLPKMAQFSEKKISPQFIATQLDGQVNYEHALRMNQDWFRGKGKTGGQDPAYDEPTFMGLPIVRIDELERTQAYPTGTGGALSTYDDTSGTDNAGPRYHWFNTKYVRMIYHARHHYQPTPPIRLPYHVETWGQQYTCWDNCVCNSPRRQATVSPAADIVNAA